MVDQLLVRLIGEGSSYQKMMQQAQRQTAGFQKQVDGMSKRIQAAGAATTKVGKRMTAGVTAPALLGAGAAINQAVKMNEKMANIATLGIEGDRLNQLKGEIQQVAMTVGKSTSDIADGAYQVVSAFGDTSDTVKILTINAKAATAGLATTEEAIALTSAVTKGYGDTSALAVSRVSDLAFTAVKLGQTTFPELAVSIGKVVPLMKALGGSQEEMFAVMATATGVTGNAAEVSTQLRGVLSAFLAPSKAATEVIAQGGFASGEAMVKQLGLMGSINMMADAARASGQPLQRYIGSIEGQTLALALSGAQAQTYTDKLAAMGGSANAMSVAFNAATQGINRQGFAWKQAKVRMAVVAQNIGDLLAPSLERLTTLLESGVQWLKSLNPAMQQVAVYAGLAAIAMGPLLMITGSLVSTFAALAPWVLGVGAAILGFINPVVLAVAAVGGLILASRALLGSWEDVGMVFSRVGQTMVNAFITTLRIQQRAWTVFAGWISVQFEKIFNINFNKAILGGLKLGGKMLLKFFSTTLEAAWNVLAGGKDRTLEDFINQTERDLGAGRNIKTLGDMSSVFKGIVGEEMQLAAMRQKDIGPIISEDQRAVIGGNLRAVQSSAATLKAEATEEAMAMKELLKRLVEQGDEGLRKPSVDFAPLSLNE